MADRFGGIAANKILLEIRNVSRTFITKVERTERMIRIHLLESVAHLFDPATGDCTYV